MRHSFERKNRLKVVQAAPIAQVVSRYILRAEPNTYACTIMPPAAIEREIRNCRISDC